VTEHLLHDFDVRAGRNGQACGGVPEFVRVQAGHADGSGRTVERGSCRPLRRRAIRGLDRAAGVAARALGHGADDLAGRRTRRIELDSVLGVGPDAVDPHAHALGHRLSPERSGPTAAPECPRSFDFRRQPCAASPASTQ
jgi:hypothetical protein